MAKVFEKRLKYVGNDLQIWKITKIFGKWLRYMVLALSIEIWHKYVENYLISEISLRCVVNGLSILEMAQEFDKRLEYVGNDVYIWEMA